MGFLGRWGLPLKRPRKPEARPTYRLRIKNHHEEGQWDQLVALMREDMIRCWDHLANRPTMMLPNRCYPLKGRYAGTWQYKPSTGHNTRVWYRVDEEARVTYIDAVFVQHPAGTSNS